MALAPAREALFVVGLLVGVDVVYAAIATAVAAVARQRPLGWRRARVGVGRVHHASIATAAFTPGNKRTECAETGTDARLVRHSTRGVPMKARNVLGFVLFIVGLILLFFGVQATGAFGEKVVHDFTGHYTDNTMTYLIGGGVSAVVGLALLFLGRGK